MSADNRRTHILDVTEDLILKVGNAGLTMRKVATAAGISLGNLQYHFATREKLLLALLVRFLEPYEERFKQQPQQLDADIVETLTPMFIEVLSVPNFDDCATIYKEIWAAASHSSEMRNALNGYYVRLAEFYREVLTTIAASGTSPEKIDRATAALLPVLEGYCVTKDAVEVPVKSIAEDWAKMAAALLR